MFMKQYSPHRCEPTTEVSFRRGWGQGAYDQRIKVIAKMLKKSRVGGGGEGGQGGYEQKIDVIVKIAKRRLRGGGGGPVKGWGGSQSGCERPIETIVKMQKKKKKRLGGVLFGVGGG